MKVYFFRKKTNAFLIDDHADTTRFDDVVDVFQLECSRLVTLCFTLYTKKYSAYTSYNVRHTGITVAT